VIGEGDGPRPKPGVQVRADYTGWLADGTRFDSSRTRFAPALFPIDKLIPGFQEGLQLMREGGTALFEIPPELGYGEKGLGDRVPPNATILFRVHLIEVID
jgi:FKBP-type peptidyl-prolyl cis-trans isomerase